MKRTIFLFFVSGCFLFSEFALPASSALEEDVSRGMVRIIAGAFTSGSEKFNDEKPEKDIYLDSFLIDKFEVTQKDFKNVMKKNPSEFRGDNRPIDRVDWYEARDYCSAVGKRLPTEAEWEKAARSGSITQYYWGSESDDSHAWHWDNSGRKTHPVGEKKPNKFGLYDIAGNVWEWTADWYDQNYYHRRSLNNPKSPFSGKHRVLRGGSFMDKTEGLRVTRRNWDLPSARFKNFGFRCAKSQNTILMD